MAPPSRGSVCRAMKRCLAARLTGRPNDDRDTLAPIADTWQEALAPLDDEALREAIAEHMRRSKFWPTPAEIMVAAKAGRAKRAERIREMSYRLTLLECSPKPEDQEEARELEAELARLKGAT